MDAHRNVDHEGSEYTSREVQHEQKKEDGFNWWPLFVLPIAFFAGWGANELLSDNNRANNNGIEYGVGGAPNVICITPIPGE